MDLKLIRKNIRILMEMASMIRDEAIGQGFQRHEAVELARDWFMHAVRSSGAAKSKDMNWEQTLAAVKLKNEQ